ncbi:NAD-dependent epimerase/dehydratase family protein [Microbacter sp. GSS18]|nr:NAD-dependent epimerase/dehydratase family protein [Microbacter sp. GSS18]
MEVFMQVVIGAGALGAATAEALVERGERVRVVSRTGAGAPEREGVESVAADVRDPESLDRAVAGAACVYQCAQPPYHRWLEDFEPLQTAVIEAAARAGANLVVADNLYGYGRPVGVLHEDSPREPVSRKGALRARMADAALEAHRAGRLRVALVRPSNFFGPRYERSGVELFRPALAGGRMTFLGGADQPHAYTYVPDAGRALAAVGTSDDGWGAAWIAPAQPAVTPRELARLVWRAAGREGDPRISVLGRRTASVLGLFSPLVRELPEMMYEFEEPFVVDSSRIQSAFGIRPTPLGEAVRASLDAFAMG